MPLYIGEDKIKSIYVGDNKIGKAYQGNELAYSSDTKNSGRLPKGYTEVEYIESDGSQYIDTKIAPENNTKIEIDFFTTKDATSAAECIFGSVRTVNAANYVYKRLQLTRNFYGFSASCGNSSVNISGNSMKGRFLVKIDTPNAIAYINGISTSLSHSNDSFNSNPYIYLLANNRLEHSTSGFASARLYSCRIFSADELVRDFVPCRNLDEDAGLYCLVQNKFYENQGTGSFVAGPEV